MMNIMVKNDYIIKKGKSIMIKDMVKEHINLQMEIDTKENGRII